jgi:drug/metabolite transporter (DMT)-like permease
MPSPAEATTLVYLGTVVSAGAFVLWYDALPRLGADRAGLFASVIPVGAIVTTVLLGLGAPTMTELGGAAVVVTGLLLGLAPAMNRFPSVQVGWVWRRRPPSAAQVPHRPIRSPQ